MSRYMNHDSTSIPKGRSVGDIVHEMTLYAKRDPEPYVRWAGEVIKLKHRIRELESKLSDLVAYCKDGYGDHEADEIINAEKLLEQPR